MVGEFSRKFLRACALFRRCAAGIPDLAPVLDALSDVERRLEELGVEGRAILPGPAPSRRRTPNALNFACSTHPSTLVVRTALIGPSQKAASKHVLIANTVRFFKYLVPEYGAEFGARMDTYVLANHATLLPPGADTLRRFETLRRVYGAEVVPASLLEFVGHAHSVEARGPLAAELLRNLLLRSETKPVVTRFFLFAPCIATLFRWLLLRVLARTEERQKRTKGDNTMKYASGFAFKNKQTRETENKKGTGQGCPADGRDPVPRRGSLSDCEGRRHAGRSE